jgi:AcrR family transcriptional regulator
VTRDPSAASDGLLTAKPRRGRRPIVARDDLVATALRLGPDRLALQGVADELGVTRTSLYYYVRDQAELGRLVLGELIDASMRGHRLPAADASWEVWLEDWARAQRDRRLALAPWLRFASGDPFVTEAGLAEMDLLIARLVECGFSIDGASQAVVFVTGLVFSNVDREIARSTSADERAELKSLEAARDRLRARPSNELASVRSAWETLDHRDPATQFDFELAAAIAGIRVALSLPGRDA